MKKKQKQKQNKGAVRLSAPYMCFCLGIWCDQTGVWSGEDGKGYKLNTLKK